MNSGGESVSAEAGMFGLSGINGSTALYRDIGLIGANTYYMTYMISARKGNKFGNNGIETQLSNIIQLACQHV